MYTTLFDSIPWEEVGISALQTFCFYWAVLIGLKLAGRRVFSEMGAQDLVILMLVAEATNAGLVHDDAGFWGSAASVLVIIATGAMIERIPPLRKLLEDGAITLYAKGRLNHAALKKHHINVDELDETAREYGLASHRDFDRLTLEGNGQITGIVRHYGPFKAKSPGPV